MPVVAREKLQDYVGQECGVTDWLEITQERVNRFADVTEDHQFIHVDPERARQTQFGGPIAHGFLTLSLLPHFGEQGAAMGVEDVAVRINYGLNKVRFLNPVPVRSKIRARYKFLGFEEKRPGQLLLSHEVTIEIQGIEKPAMIAEALGMSVLK
ncbi:MaoC family dehydratase [Gilvimarinus sp. F26214L]|uniref:MaoC family dehydratase n=1 Tax=Gilvimarinus sp. DZF01 TaxID=3461371 RepID=UPI0040462E1F